METKSLKETHNNLFSFYRTSKKLLKIVLINIGEIGKKAWWLYSII